MEYYLSKLKTAGFKITPRRKAIVGMFVRGDTHLTAEAVWRNLQKEFSLCGLPSVYRNLESLVECGVLTRIQQFDRKKHYGLCTMPQTHHHHITCVECGKVEAITECALADKRKIRGYTVISHFFQVNGICAGCAAGPVVEAAE